ncbi:MAG: hypothetical protein HRT98_04310 [Mycoplasmatales bacterium]|nr:hypothetical protein [Mycoplasmatales bacterium]
MNKKIKAGTLGVITLLSSGIIGAGTVLALRTTQDGNNNGIGINESAKTTIQNFGGITRPDFDAIDNEGINNLERKINENLKSININKKINLTTKFKKQENVKVDEVKKIIEDFIKEIKKEIQVKLDEESAKTVDLETKLSDSKTIESTAKTDLDKAIKMLNDEKAKTAGLVKISNNTKAAQILVEKAVKDAQNKLDTEVAKTIVLVNRVQDLKTAKAKLEALLKANKKEFKQARKKVSNAQENLNNAKAKFETAKKAKIASHILTNLADAQKQQKFAKKQLEWDADWEKSMIKTKASIAALKKRRDEHQDLLDYWEKEEAKIKKTISDKLPNEIKTIKEAQKKLNEAIKNRDAIKNNASVKNAQKDLDKINAELKTAQDKLDANTKAINDLNEANKRAIKNLENAKIATKTAQDKLDANTKAINDLNTKLKALEKISIQIKANAYSIDTINKFKEAWKKAIKEIKGIKVDLKSITIDGINAEAKKLMNSYEVHVNTSVSNLY